MSDFSVLCQPTNHVIISPSSLESVGVELGHFVNITAPSSGTWPVANRAIFIPFCVYTLFNAQKMGVYNGATANANIEPGIYDDQGNKLTAIGSTAQAGTNVIQSFDINPDVMLLPGVYYMALAMSATTGTVFRSTPAAVLCAAMGMLSQSTAFALPSTATFVTPADGFVPQLFVAGRSVI